MTTAIAEKMDFSVERNDKITGTLVTACVDFKVEAGRFQGAWQVRFQPSQALHQEKSFTPKGEVVTYGTDWFKIWGASLELWLKSVAPYEDRGYKCFRLNREEADISNALTAQAIEVELAKHVGKGRAAQVVKVLRSRFGLEG